MYPRSWTEYQIPELRLTLVCRQISPIIPHNYKDSSLPVAVFVWSIENHGDESLDVSITFTFKNGMGGKSDKKGGCWTECFEEPDDKIFGVMIHQTIRGMNCTYGIASRAQEGSFVSRKTHFNPLGSGAEIWDDLKTDGQLRPSPAACHRPTGRGEQAASAVCCSTNVKPGLKSTVEFALSWDMPKIHFTGRKNQYFRMYTRWFGTEGNAAPGLCKYALQNYVWWEQEIEKWQKPILEDKNLPAWYKSALFNELYYVADGGSVWLEVDGKEQLSPDDPRREYGRFGYLEGHEYRMYNTYDVHFYASFALAQLWPKLQQVIQFDIRDAIAVEDSTVRTHLYDEEEPFEVINTYPIHDVCDWRDLNLKFVLQVFRDFSLWGDLKYLRAMWPSACAVMKHAVTWDKDEDGLIENGGFPDQTYDSWVMSGPSAYCGSLWLAALLAMTKMADNLQEPQEPYHSLLCKGKKSFQEKLWNGQYYKFDSSGASHSTSIMSDQLCGQWYLRACGVDDENGTMGAVNGMLPDGRVDLYTIQSEEVWVGTVYALAALMLHEGMIEEAFKTASGIYHTVYDRIGMGFETPEALYAEKHYRAIGYMRPLSIWAMQLAWEKQGKGTDESEKCDVIVE
ncbi:hypothetical protein B566_EDAN007248 [Ephemera danica]|nr:hypothetical protein B566_EDAN007248 [Ephemera danica]